MNEELYINCLECGKRMLSDTPHTLGDCVSELKARVMAYEAVIDEITDSADQRTYALLVQALAKRNLIIGLDGAE